MKTADPSAKRSRVSRRVLTDVTEFITYVGAHALELASKEELTAKERILMEATAQRISTIGGTFLWLVDQDPDLRRAKLLRSLFVGAASASFAIGGFALSNRFQMRIMSNTASATKARILRSGLIDELIVTIAQPLWLRHPRRSAHWIAHETISILNAELLKLRLPLMKTDAVRKRLKKCRAKIFCEEAGSSTP
jgi:hypothetical protein